MFSSSARVERELAAFLFLNLRPPSFPNNNTRISVLRNLTAIDHHAFITIPQNVSAYSAHDATGARKSPSPFTRELQVRKAN